MAKGGLGLDGSALAPGQESTGAATPESEPDLGLPQPSAPIVLATAGASRPAPQDTWWNAGRR
jgi:hypothetical protein